MGVRWASAHILSRPSILRRSHSDISRQQMWRYPRRRKTRRSSPSPQPMSSILLFLSIAKDSMRRSRVLRFLLTLRYVFSHSSVFTTLSPCPDLSECLRAAPCDHAPRVVLFDIGCGPSPRLQSRSNASEECWNDVRLRRSLIVGHHNAILPQTAVSRTSTMWEATTGKEWAQASKATEPIPSRSPVTGRLDRIKT